MQYIALARPAIAAVKPQYIGFYGQCFKIESFKNHLEKLGRENTTFFLCILYAEVTVSNNMSICLPEYN